MNEKKPLPQSVLESYEVFSSGDFRLTDYFTPPIPMSPDTTYAIYENKNKLYTLVTTDYPSVANHSSELFKLSGIYEFDSLLAPDGTSKLIAIQEDDELDLNFFIKEDNTYYYCASITEVDNS